MSRKDRARKGGPDERRQSDRPYIAAVTASTVLIAGVGLLALVFMSDDGINPLAVVAVVAAVLGLLLLGGLALLDRRR